MKLEGRVAIITAAGRGIGRGSALAEEGAGVVVNSYREETIDTFGRIDIPVNNVGSGSKTPKEPGSGPLWQIMAIWDTT